MEVTREQLIELLNQEMTELKLKIIDHTWYAFNYYKEWSTEEEHLKWKKESNESMECQRRYIATKYTKAVFTVQYSENQKFSTHTCDVKKLIADVVDYYGKKKGDKAEVTWDMTPMQIEMKY